MSHSNTVRLTTLLGMLCLLSVVRSEDSQDTGRNQHAACPLLYIESSHHYNDSVNCHVTSFLLRCQVSGADRLNNFSIKWHYSRSQPDISNTARAAYINNSTTNIHHDITLVSSSTTCLVSQLNVTGFGDMKGDGYYWCSVDSSNASLTMALHVMYQVEVEVKYHDEHIIIVHKNYPTAQCAGQVAGVENVVEPQDCVSTAMTNAAEATISAEVCTDLPTATGQTTTSKTTHKPTTALESTGLQTTALESTGLQTTTTVTSVAPSPSLNTGVVVGASMGGLILILCLVIGILMVCVMRMKLKRPTREHSTDLTSPFDDIHMYSSEVKVGKDKIMDDANRASKMLFDSNISYECPRVAVSQPTDNIYDYIHVY